MKSKGIKLAALSSYYHSSEKMKKYENIYVMNYSFVDCEKMEYVAKMITQVEWYGEKYGGRKIKWLYERS